MFQHLKRNFCDKAVNSPLVRQLTHCRPVEFTKGFSGLESLRTPAFVVNIDAVKRNCVQMSETCRKHKVALRAHVKTHKSLEIARLQVANESVKRIEVSTLAEAWHFAETLEFDDILYGVPLCNSKIREVLELNQWLCHASEQRTAQSAPTAVRTKENPRVSVMVDSEEVVDDIIRLQSDTGSFKALPLEVFIKVDAGYRRAGIDISAMAPLSAAEEMHAMAAKLDKSPYTTLKGVYSYSGQTYTTAGIDFIQESFIKEKECVLQCVKRLSDAISAETMSRLIVSVGNTPVAILAEDFSGVNEIHPGNYSLFDSMQRTFGSCDSAQIACFVVARVIGVYPQRNELLLDCGSVALSKERGPAVDGCEDFAQVLGHSQLQVYSLSQEVAKVRCRVPGQQLDFSVLKRDSILKLLPYHSCITACSFPFFYVCDDSGTLVDVFYKVTGW